MPTEVVEDGVSGFIVSDVDQAVEAVRHAGDLNRLLVRRAFERRFPVEAMARAYLEIYSGLPGTRTGVLPANWHDAAMEPVSNVVRFEQQAAA